MMRIPIAIALLSAACSRRVRLELDEATVPAQLDEATVPAQLDRGAVELTLAAAAAWWRACGEDVELGADDVRVRFGPLPDPLGGHWQDGTITIRDDGRIWAPVGEPCAGRVLLVEEFKHEIGHVVLGHDHDPSPSAVMNAGLPVCMERLACP